MNGELLHSRYQIIRTIGEGGCGQTFLARDTHKVDTPFCVVKYLKKSNFSFEASLWERTKERFKQEAKLLDELGLHEQIPQFWDYFEEDDEFYLVQEFIEGDDLKQILTERQRLSEIELIPLLQDVLEVLAFVHRQGVIHRDIKPANLIWRRHDAKMVLIDFGIVKEISREITAVGRTVPTAAVGTPGYIAPEQYGRNPCFGSDIYSLGITAIQALIGGYPQQDQETCEIIWRHQAQVSESLAQILDKMVLYNSHERYQSARQVLNDLEPLSVIGKTLGGRYRIIRVIRYLGRGIFGSTYLTNQQGRLQQSRCIIKQVKFDSEQLTWQRTRELFIQQVELLYKVANYAPIAPRILDSLEENQNFYLVQEFIEGDDIGKEIVMGRRFSQEEVIAILQDILETLELIHTQGIIHGNIKPSNLIRRKNDKKIVLIDFGTVQEIANSSVNLHRQRLSLQVVVGTPGYMPKEQWEGRPTLASDIYALGMTAIQALTGLSPEHLNRHKQTDTIILSSGTQVSKKLATILNKMVHPNFMERYQSATDVLEHLRSHRVREGRSQQFVKPKFILFFLAAVGAIFVGYKLYLQTKANVLYDQAESFKDAGRFSEALTVYDEELSIKPDDFQAWQARGYVLGKLNRPADKLTSCEKAIEINPQDSYSWICKGLALNDLKSYPESIAAFDEALKFAPRSREALNNKGEVLIQLQKYQEALENFNKAIQISPDYLFALTNKANVLYRMQKYEEANEAYKRALAIKSDYQPALEGQKQTQIKLEEQQRMKKKQEN